jgi:CubicO group peptidase (beta-lactamase class C family)
MNRPTSLSRAALAAALCLAAAPASGQAAESALSQAARPATAAEVLAGAIAEAIDSSDTAAISRLLAAKQSAASQQPRDEILVTLRGIREKSGGVTLGASRTTPRGNAVVELWSRRGDAGVLISVYPDSADSTRLLRVAVGAPLRRGGEFRPFPVERMDDARIVRLIGDELRRLADLDELSGVVLVGKGDQVLFQGAYGFENPFTHVPITTRTRFHIASQGKMFTSISIAQLVEQRRLSLDDTLGALLPAQPWTAQARGITVRQLLTHTAGLGGLFDRPNYPEGHVFRTATERLSIFASEPLLFAPGTRWSYSNEGFETLGAIIEAKTGMRYNDYIRQHVLLSAGMATALPDAPADSLTDRAIPSPHAEDDWFGLRTRTTASRGWNAGGAGGGHVSAEDMFRFARAVVGGRLVSRAMVDTLTTRRVSQGNGRDYGYGFEPRTVNGRTVFGHGGGGPRGVAICNDIDIFGDGSWTVVVMSNYDAPLCSTLKASITEMLAVN